VEERERVVEMQRIILGDSWATDVFFEGCWFGVVGVGLAGKNRSTALGGTNRPTSPPNYASFQVATKLRNTPCLPNSTQAAPLPLSSEM